MAQALGKIPQTVPVYNQREADEKFAEVTDLCSEIQDEITPLRFAQYYPDGSVKSAAEFTSGIKYDDPDTTNRTITVKPFCNTGDSANDNSSLSGRVVIPPFVDAQDNGYISDDGTRYKVVGVSGSTPLSSNANLTAIVAPSTVTTIGDHAFRSCTSLASVSLPAATRIGDHAFSGCTSLASVSLPAATSIGDYAFINCTSLVSVQLPAATSIVDGVFRSCTSLASVDFGATPRATVPPLGSNAFSSVPTTCKIIVPYTQYDAWTAASGWSALQQEFVRHAEKADKPATFTTGNLAKFDANGNPTDSGKSAADFMPANAKIQRIYNEVGTDALDDKGQLFKSSIPGASKFLVTQNGTTTEWPFYRYQSEGNAFNGHSVYSYGTWFTDLICYDPTDGVVGFTHYNQEHYARNTYVWKVQVPKGLDPRAIGSVLFSGTLSGVQFGADNFRDVAWAGRVPTVEPDPYARFAIEDMPTVWAASTTYTVGVCASYDGKAYRCKTEHTSGSTFDASKWDEIPVLAQKADKPATFTTGNLAKFDSEGNPIDSGKSPSDFLEGITIFDYDAVTWTDVIAAYDKQGMVYVRVPVDGQTGAYRYGSLTYLLDRRSDPTKTDAKAEFLYYRTINKSNSSSFEDEAWIYTVVEHPDRTTTTNGWRTEKRPILNAFPDWAKNTAYTPDSVVLRNNILYRCTVAHTSGNSWDSSKWAVTTFRAIIADCRRYSLVTKTMSGGAVTLDDRAYNYVDARVLGSSDSIDIDFPALVNGKSRDFVLAVECGANPPTISYAAFVTIMAEGASSLTPEEGMNIYSFTEFKTNMFIASRKLVSTVVDNSPESGDQLLLAMQERGIDTTGITSFGGVETALGLSDTNTPQDAIDAIMN